MKRIYTTILAGFSCLAMAQAPAIQWQKCFGGTSSDQAYDMVQTTDNGYIVGGLTTSNDGDVANQLGGSDFWIVKLDANGTLQWKKNYGGSLNDWFSRIIQTADGGYFMVGTTNSINGHAVGNHNNLTDGIAIKTDASGNVLWSRCYGGTQSDYFKSTKQLADGTYMVVGETTSSDGDVGSNHNPQTNDAWVLHLDASGNILWEHCYGSTGFEKFSDLDLTPDGGCVFIGEAYTSNFSGDVTDTNGLFDIWVVKTNATGAIQWQQTFGGSNQEAANTIKYLSDGSYIATGLTRSNDGDVTSNHGASDFWVLKLNASGNLQWQRCYGGTAEDVVVSDGEFGSNILEMPDGNFVFSCKAASTNGDVIGNHGSTDFWIGKIGSAGQILWQKCMGGTNADASKTILKTNDNGFAVCGFAWSSNGDVTGHHGNSDYWIVKLGSDNLATTEFENPGLGIYPNPATSLLHVELPHKDSVQQIKIYDFSGKCIHQTNVSTINVDAFSTGTYFIEALSSGKTYRSQFIKQ
ncbi:T9SS type A sorting domain-containing protein [Flavobacterium sp.]|uniref:T9SS type A sorting domain-containing protein n=1 Tax=Flavobacterium sp. TaxID=239 RepID=UPI0039E37E18